jgi:hypothetical protein
LRIRCAAAASTAIRPVLDGHPAPGRILGCSGVATWIAVADEVVVVAASGAVRLPNGVMLGIPSGRAPLGFGTGDAEVGGGGVVFGSLEVRVVRWWDPRPALSPATAAGVLTEVSALRERVEFPDDAGLGRALAARDPRAALQAASGLLGRGDGLTPAGDDLMAGALAGCLLIGAAVGEPSAVAVVEAVAGPLGESARHRTTTLSATLLRHACRGEVADAAAALLGALTGRGSAATACDAVRAVGHSSGPALAAGILTGAAAAAGREAA